MHIKPKKRLGQNFLIDRNIQRKIIDSCELKPSDKVLEIGSGRGELTRLIAHNVERVFALELDQCLCNILKDNLKGYSNVKIINQDILRFNFRTHFGKSKNKIKVIGNIPYYIATPIIKHLLESRDTIDTIFITIQKELARRIVATSGSKTYGALSCFVQYYAEPKAILFIKKNCFLPSPKIGSCLLRLKIRRTPVVKPKDEEFLFKIIRATFNKRRKTLRNSLKGIISQSKLNMFFRKFDIDSNIRPEALSLSDFINLVNL